MDWFYEPLTSLCMGRELSKLSNLRSWRADNMFYNKGIEYISIAKMNV